MKFFNGDSVALYNSIKSDIDLCASDPINANLFLAGDFNLTSTQGKAYSFSDPIPVAIVEAGKTAGCGKLQQVLLQLTEVEAGLLTRYNSAIDKGTTIDRVFTNLPTYLFPVTKWVVNIGCCKEMYLKHLSDHAILSVHAWFKEIIQHLWYLYDFVYNSQGCLDPVTPTGSEYC